MTKYRTDLKACSCPGFWYRRRCRHIIAYREAVALVQAQDAVGHVAQQLLLHDDGDQAGDVCVPNEQPVAIVTRRGSVFAQGYLQIAPHYTDPSKPGAGSVSV